MKITVQCTCKESFTLNSVKRKTSNFTCPNCSQKLPDYMIEHINKLFTAQEELYDDCERVTESDGKYAVKLSDL